MALPTPRSKERKSAAPVLPRAHVVFWRAFPNGEMCPTDPEGKHLFIYNLELPGTGLSTMGYYMKKGYRPVALNIKMPLDKKGPIIEGIEAQLSQVIEQNVLLYEKTKKEFKPEMLQNVLDEVELERRTNMNAMLRHQAGQARKATTIKEGRGKGASVAEEAGVL